eukprot:6201340-Pleurochrysis_carterae.AAC.1
MRTLARADVRARARTRAPSTARGRCRARTNVREATLAVSYFRRDVQRGVYVALWCPQQSSSNGDGAPPEDTSKRDNEERYVDATLCDSPLLIRRLLPITP